MRVSEIRVNQIRVNQGLGVLRISDTLFENESIIDINYPDLLALDLD